MVGKSWFNTKESYYNTHSILIHIIDTYSKEKASKCCEFKLDSRQAILNYYVNGWTTSGLGSRLMMFSWYWLRVAVFNLGFIDTGFEWWEIEQTNKQTIYIYVCVCVCLFQTWIIKWEFMKLRGLAKINVKAIINEQ